jgi:hypothetical protein
VYALALQPPLQVGEGDEDGIDIPLVDPPAKIMNTEIAGVTQLCHVVPHSLVECTITTPGQ